MRAEVEVRIVSGASHLFERGALAEAATLASGWLTRHLARATGA
jgi:hypothetical protein